MDSSNAALIVSNPDQRDELVTAVSSSGLSTRHCSNLEAARSLLGRSNISMLFCDETLCGDKRQFVRQISLSGPQIPVILVSRRDNWDLYLDALRAGAFDRVVLPATPGEVARIVRAALRTTVPATEAKLFQAPRKGI
jgi:DNA-binding NtrC family response regulator